MTTSPRFAVLLRDFLTVPHSHPFLMRPARVHALILRFRAG